MGAVKIEATQQTTAHKMTKLLTVFLGLLTVAVIFISHSNPSITGGAVFSKVYGGASPFVILFVLGVVIYLYMKLR